MNLADLQAPTASHVTAFRQFVLEGTRRWAASLLEHAIRHDPAAVPRAGLANAPLPAQMPQRLRAELAEPLTRALQAQLDAHRAEHAGLNRDGADAQSLTLVPEAQIDDEIETARIVQRVESESERERHELAALTSRLHVRDRIDMSTVPLGPLACARALRQATDEAALEAPHRSMLLRGLGDAMAAQMRGVYAEMALWLRQRGVEPIGQGFGAGDALALGSADTVEAQPAASGLAGPESPMPPAESMRELVAWASRVRDAPQEAAQALQVLTLRLDPQPALGSAVPRLPQAAADDLMQRLFAELRRQAARSPSMTGLLRCLEQLARRVAADDPGIWSDPGHAWWQLMDRLLAAAAVRDDLCTADQRALGDSLEGFTQRLLDSAQLDGQAFLRAADKVQRLASQLLERATSPNAEDVVALQQRVDHGELERAFRSQIVQQLHSTPTSGLMRRFLLEPWTQVLVAKAMRHGASDEAVAAAALVVDDLIRATSRPGVKVSRAQRTVLLRQVADGLAAAGMPQPRIDAELVELAAILRKPPPHPTNPAEAWTAQPAEPLPLPMPVPLDMHAGLPTVPLDCGPGDGRADPVQTSEQWAATLHAGSLCRLFLQGLWMTVRLNWVGPGQRLFLFQSRHGGRSHTLTLRMLCRLREAGLATHIEDNLLRAQAMASVLRHTGI